MVSCLSCTNKSQNRESSQPIHIELPLLETLNDKQLYLEGILEDDQKVRGEKGALIILKYGSGSKEDWEYINAQWKQDSINLIKIEQYLGKHGYPSKEELGKDAALIPWLVVHHAKAIEPRYNHFEELYKAYLLGDVNETQMSLYLGRFYEKLKGARFNMESPYTYEDEIHLLIKHIGLEERRREVMQKTQIK